MVRFANELTAIIIQVLNLVWVSAIDSIRTLSIKDKGTSMRALSIRTLSIRGINIKAISTRTVRIRTPNISHSALTSRNKINLMATLSIYYDQSNDTKHKHPSVIMLSVAFFIVMLSVILMNVVAPSNFGFFY